MAAGLISKGTVDERSITELKPSDLEGYERCHFFSGIAGWEAALKLAGWPEDKPVWTGSCPCQPFSQSGKRKGKRDERDLWPEFKRLIEACRPETIFGEQVASSDVIGSMAGKRSKLPADLPATQPGQGLSSTRKVQIEKEENQLRLGLTPAGTPSPDRQRSMRDYRPSVQAGWWTDMGQPVTGQDRCEAGLHLQQHPGRLPCGEQRAGRLGRGEADGNCASDFLETNECVKRVVAAHWRELEEADQLEWLARVQFGLESLHYAFGSCVLPAAGVSAPQIRQRLYWVAIAQSDKWNRSIEYEDPAGRAGLADGCKVVGMESANQRGWNARCSETNASATAVELGLSNKAVIRLEHSDDTRRKGWNERRNSSGKRIVGPESVGFWEDFDIIPVGDKLKRISSEPGAFPLAARLPGDLAKLRAYGNSIVPQVAAAFIQAVTECV